MDGLSLLRVYHNPQLQWKNWIPPEIEPQVKQLDDALDALADLTLTESVYQLSRGNAIRAGATLDAIARGDAPPPEVDVVQTPRSGATFTQRLLALGSAAGPGWADTPRAKAAPRLNGWVASLLGDPKRVRARGSFVDTAGAVVGSVEVGLDRLRLAPLDLIAIPASADPAVGELADRVRRALAAARPATVPAVAKLELLAARDPAWSADIVSITEYAELIRAVRETLAGARALAPQDIVVPGDTAGGIDLAELQARADAAEAALRAAARALVATGAGEAALLAAADFGSGAYPSGDPAKRPAEIAIAATELGGRVRLLDGLASGFNRADASADEQRDRDIARLKAVFGEAFVVLPVLGRDAASAWSALWGNSAALQGGDPCAAVAWFQRVARVRSGAGRLDRALLYAEALGVPRATAFDVAQLPPVNPADGWVALKASGAGPFARVALAVHVPQPLQAGSPVAGLVLDEWVEVLPASQQVTGLTFQFDDPYSRPPQAILIGVRPHDFPEWTCESVEGSILEALELAKLRAVDPEALQSVGHYLPALFFAYNLGGAQVNAVSTDLSTAAPAPAS